MRWIWRVGVVGFVVIGSVELYAAPRSTGAQSADVPTYKAGNLDPRLAAAFEGGEVTVEELGARIREMNRGGQLLPSYESLLGFFQDTTRDLAVHKILLKEADRLNLRARPDWPLRQVLAEQSALAQLIREAVWDSVTLTEDEIQEFVRQNHGMHQSVPGARGTAYIWEVPTEAEFYAFWAKANKVGPAQDAMREEAADTFPIVCLMGPTTQSAEGQDPASTQPTSHPAVPMSQPFAAETPIFECGTIRFNAGEYPYFFDSRFNVQFRGCGDLTMFKNAVGEDLQLGELARSKGFRKVARFDEVFRAQKEKWLTSVAKEKLLDEWSHTEATSEQRIKDYWENDFKGYEPALLTYDVLVVPVPYAGQTEDELKTQKAAAQAKAEQIIARIQSGTSFDEAPKRFEGLNTMYGERRHLEEDAPLFDLIKGVEPGQVIPQPYEDFGGFCVFRVNEFRARRKLPLEYSRGAVVNDLQFRHRTEFYGTFAETLFEKHKCVFNYQILNRMVREGAKP